MAEPFSFIKMAEGDTNHCVMSTTHIKEKIEEPVKQQIGKSSYRFEGCNLTAYRDVKNMGSSLYSRTSGLNLENQERILDHLRCNRVKHIKDAMRKNQIPNICTTITAIMECGYNKSIRCLLKLMSKVLTNEIPNSVRSWCGFRPQDPDCPVFVVTLEHPRCAFDKNKIRKPFCDYDIVMRYNNVPNDEEKTILEKTGTKLFKGEDYTRVHICIAQNTKSLMTQHSNLSMIRGSYVKSKDYVNTTHQMVEETCIVFSVPVKGIIPIGEKAFPKSIDGISTDVREGEFILFADHNANSYHDKLRMGCCISRPETGLSGTLGGFVDLPGNKIGCLTAAHVVLTEDEITQYKNHLEQSHINYGLQNGQPPLQMYQPYRHADSFFGHVHTIALKDGRTSVDAAIIAITNDNRNPETGNFPEGDFSTVGFPIEKPMTFNSGKILDSISLTQSDSPVIKFGSATGITRGDLGWDGTSVRKVTNVGRYCFPVMYGQLEITSPGFADKGDSGALAFICYGGNKHNLHAIGMVIGGSSTGCSTVITPIKAIFHELGLSENRCKEFCPNLASSSGQTMQDIAASVQKHEHALEEQKENLNKVSEIITTLDININRRVDILENTLTNINRRVEILENTLMQGFNEIKQLLLSNSR